MLTGPLVRVKTVKGVLRPQYLRPADPHWLGVAADLLKLFSNAAGRTRGELEDDVAAAVGDGPAATVPQGLAKLLFDRCDFEVEAEVLPAEIRADLFRRAALARQMPGVPFDRSRVLAEAAAAFKLPAEVLDRSLYADLKTEQRLLSFEALSSERLLARYNVALAQAVLLKSVGLTVRMLNEPPARVRQLLRAAKFHRLIAAAKTVPGGVELRVEGPLALFQATQKSFELNANILWGVAKQPREFQLAAADGLTSHTADFGTFVPPGVELFAASFRDTIDDWILDPEAQILSAGETLWVPDFVLTHRKTGKIVYVEVFGYWRKADIEAVHAKLNAAFPKQFLIVAGEGMRADATEEADWPGLVLYKRTPSAAAVAKAATALLK
jgi:uncharacterized protein